ncbi:MAG: hypothetical protein WAR79_08895 [Melioribacteraceae bacterium]
MSEYEKKKVRGRDRRRASKVPVICYLKEDNWLLKNFLKGIVGDQINVMLSASAFNLKKWMRKTETFYVSFYKGIKLHIFCFLELNLKLPKLKITF